MEHPNKKNRQVRYKYSEAEVAEASESGHEISAGWKYSPLLTMKSAVRYYNELKLAGYDAELIRN